MHGAKAPFGGSLIVYPSAKADGNEDLEKFRLMLIPVGFSQRIRNLQKVPALATFFIHGAKAPGGVGGVGLTVS